MGGVPNAPGPSPTLGSLGPSHQWRHKSRASLRGPPCAHGVAGTPQGEVRDNNGVGQVVGVGGDAPLDVRNEVNIAESNWINIFKEKAIDLLLEQHSPATMRVLQQMQTSQYMRDALEIFGSARHSRAVVRRALDMNPANEAGPSNPRPGYEIPLPIDEPRRVVVVDDTDSD